MNNVVEQKRYKFPKKKDKTQQQQAPAPKPRLGPCKFCRQRVQFLVNILGDQKIYFCPNCKKINARVTMDTSNA